MWYRRRVARVVISGMGCVTPIGIGRAQFESCLLEGTSGVGPITAFDPEPFACRVAAEVKRFRAEEHMDLREARALPRVAQFAVASTRMALADADIGRWRDPGRVAMVFGTSSGSLAYAFEQHAVFLDRGMKRMHPSAPVYAHNSVVSSECAIQFNIRGPVMVISSACTSSTDSVGIGAAMIASGVADVVLVGGADAPLTPALFGAFDRLGMMPRSFNDVPVAAARPFDRRREGLVLGEGAVTFVLEDEVACLERGGMPAAVVRGYGATCDAHSHFRQDPEGGDAVRAIASACSMAGWQNRDIQFVAAHGTGTRENDPFEAKVLNMFLDDQSAEAWVCASKSQCGHLLGASGAVGVATVLASMRSGYAAATLNLGDPDEDCRLRHVRSSKQSCRVERALVTSFGFGARNAALVLERYE